MSEYEGTLKRADQQAKAPTHKWDAYYSSQKEKLSGMGKTLLESLEQSAKSAGKDSKVTYEKTGAKMKQYIEHQLKHIESR